MSERRDERPGGWMFADPPKPRKPRLTNAQAVALDRAALVAAVEGLRQHEDDHGNWWFDPDDIDRLLRDDIIPPLPAAPTIDRAALEAAGFEPDFNVCALCKHRGGDHDLRNVCLICGDRFAEMSTDEKWAHGVALLHRGETGTRDDPRDPTRWGPGA